MRDTPVLVSVLLLGGLFGLGAALVLGAGATTGMSRYIYLSLDLAGFAAAIGAMGAVLIALRLSPEPLIARAGRVPMSPALLWALAALTLVLTVAGTGTVHHGFAFSMDEWMVRLQGAVFASGETAGTVAEAFRPHGRAMFHDFAFYEAATGQVASSYRPGMAVLHALFETAGLGIYVSAVLTAASVVLAAAVARQIWPDRPEAPAVAALLLACSQQALAMGLTSYAMPAHLCFNLLWLWLFLGDTRWGHFLAPWVGVATAALHQIHPHLFFALPFLLLLLKPFRPWLILYYGAVYALGHLAVWQWNPLSPAADLAADPALSESAAATVGTVTGSVGALWDKIRVLAVLPGSHEITTVIANLARLMAWQSLALMPLLLLLRRQDWSPLPVLLAASIALSLVPYPILMPDQGHGWGYRYLHGLLGNLALLGTAGWLALARVPEPARLRLRAGVLALSAMTLLVMVALRGAQISELVGRYAAASAAVAAMDAGFVVVDDHAIYYGKDLIRNRALAQEPPVALRLGKLTDNALARLCAGHRVAYFGADAAAAFEIPTSPNAHLERIVPGYAEARAQLAAPGCAAPGQD